ncbi:hypothetical protein AcW1_004490 [Taiwanofungus camphoratus]|nr:hypothetical protein AcW1_004490 [Antrodia cinnamomea]
MASTPREIGTLIVVVLKAKNLPNKRHIGKQDPYCSVVLNGEKRRTKAIRRGGQHPEWDEEVRFTLFEDVNDELASHGDGTPPPPPKSNGKGPPKIKGGKFMGLACYADDPREPDLIGETTVDLTEVLTRGETDEWFTIMNKDKYCGEVYLELTFWSNEPPPVKKVTPKPKTKQYGGPGSFVPAGESPSHNGFEGHQVISRLPSTNSMREELRPENIPLSLRSSSSLAKLDLYVPPYETARSHRSAAGVDSTVNEFAELGIGDVHRRQSFPPQQGGYFPRSSSSIVFPDPQGLSPQSSHGFHQNTYSDAGMPYSLDRPMTPTASLSHHPSSISVNHDQYQPPYESTQSPSLGYPAPARHAGPRYSIPSAPSGFMPMPTPAPSGFVPLPTHATQPSGFVPPSTPTPAPLGYAPPPSHFPVPSVSYSTLPPPPIVPSGFVSTGPSGQYHQSLPQPPSGYPYAPHVPPSTHPQPQQSPAPPASTPPHSHTAPPQQSYVPSQSVPPQSQSASLEQYSTHTVSPPHDHIPPPPPLNETTSSGQNPASRPLPQPTQSYGQPSRRRQSSLPAPPPGGPPGMYNPPGGVSGSYNSPIGLPGSYTTPENQPASYNPPPGPPTSYNSPPGGPSGPYNPPSSGSPGSYNRSGGSPGPHHTPTGGSVGSYNPPSGGRSVSFHHPSGGPSGSYSTAVGGSSGTYNPPGTTSDVCNSSGSSSGSYNPSQGALSGPYDPQGPSSAYTTGTFNSIPPPPPLPRQSTSPSPYPHNGQAPVQSTPPVVPPASQYHQDVARRASLPPPPPLLAYPNQQQSTYQPLPPPPPPPNLPPHAQYEPISSFPSSSHSQTFHPGPPPRPPAQPGMQPQYMSSPVSQHPHGSFAPPLVEKDW